MGGRVLVLFTEAHFSEFSQHRLTGASGRESTLAASHFIKGVGQMTFGYRTAIVLTAAALVGGCATSGLHPHDSDSRASSSTVLTAQEITRNVLSGSTLTALKRLRPAWLLPRGGAPGVSVDGGPPTDLSVLDWIQASTIAEVRLERASSNLGIARVAANGTVIIGDVIIVTTRHGGKAEP